MKSPEQKRLRDRANRNRRALLKEKEIYGHIDDGAGKRYTIGVDYVLAGENQKALDYYSWYETEFPDDIGEPISSLYWALCEYRSGDIQRAILQLKTTMLSNLYLLPHLFHEPLHVLDIWHSTNMEEKSYLHDAEEYLNEPNDNERQWIKTLYNEKSFVVLREKYVKVFNSLKYEKRFEKRCNILNDWDSFLMNHLK